MPYIYLLTDNLGVCSTLKPFLTILGYVVTIVKIVIPILLIIFGMLDVGKSVVAGKPDEITKNLKSFAMRCLAAVLIFFIPSIVGLLMNAVSQSGDGNTVDTSNANDWQVCWKTVLGVS